MFTLDRIQPYFSFPVHKKMDHGEYYRYSLNKEQNLNISLSHLIHDYIPQNLLISKL